MAAAWIRSWAIAWPLLVDADARKLAGLEYSECLRKLV